MVLFYCIFTLSIYNCCHTLCNSSGLVKRIHLMCKAGSIQIESYSLLPKVYRKFMTNFSSKRKPQFQVFFGQDSFPMNTSLFQASLRKTLPTVYSLMDGGMPAFTITIFTETFPISSC